MTQIAPPSPLPNLFTDTTASYKFYWMLGLLDLAVREGRTAFPATAVLARMIARAAYPIVYHHLSFGFADKLGRAIEFLRTERGLDASLRAEENATWIEGMLENDKEVRKELIHLLDNVPYRFLNPWLNNSDNKQIVALSQAADAKCIYTLTVEADGLHVSIRPEWEDYLKAHYLVLHDYTLWHLSLFLLKRNPNVPAITSKLERPDARASLSKQRELWRIAMAAGQGIKCIYTNIPLTANDFDLDHFIPWSFVAHDQLWNLIPAHPSINSSKSDRLPNLDIFLPRLANVHQSALRTWLDKTPGSTILEDFTALKCAPADLIKMPSEALLDVYRRVFTPLYQIAENTGFEPWGKTA